MPKGRDRLSAALHACGAVLKRDKKHLVYELPNGKHLTVSATPGDVRSEDNALADLRHALDAGRPKTATVNPPREKRRKPGRIAADRWGIPSEVSPLAAALRDTGLIEQQLRCRIGQLEADLAHARDEWEAAAAERDVLEALWVVRLWRWWHEGL
jgi:hypothetical protein